MHLLIRILYVHAHDILANAPYQRFHFIGFLFNLFFLMLCIDHRTKHSGHQKPVHQTHNVFKWAICVHLTRYCGIAICHRSFHDKFIGTQKETAWTWWQNYGQIKLKWPETHLRTMVKTNSCKNANKPKMISQLDLRCPLPCAQSIVNNGSVTYDWWLINDLR